MAEALRFVCTADKCPFGVKKMVDGRYRMSPADFRNYCLLCDKLKIYLEFGGD